jgi:hypothetical protein
VGTCRGLKGNDLEATFEDGLGAKRGAIWGVF